MLGNGSMDCNYTAPSTTTPFYSSTTTSDGEFTSQIFTHDVGFSTTAIPPNSSDAISTDAPPVTIDVNEETVTPSNPGGLTTSDVPNSTVTKSSWIDTTTEDVVLGDSTTEATGTTISAETTTVTDDGVSTEGLLTTVGLSGSAGGSTGPEFRTTIPYEETTIFSSPDSAGHEGPHDTSTVGATSLPSSTMSPTETTIIEDETTISTGPSSTTIKPFFTDSPDRDGLGTSTIEPTQYTTIVEDLLTTPKIVDTTHTTTPSNPDDWTTWTPSSTTTFSHVENSTEMVDCMKTSCLNGGSCISTSEGDKVFINFNPNIQSAAILLGILFITESDTCTCSINAMHQRPETPKEHIFPQNPHTSIL